MIHKDRSTFIDEITGLAIFKILDKKAQSTVKVKLKFIRKYGNF